LQKLEKLGVLLLDTPTCEGSQKHVVSPRLLTTGVISGLITNRAQNVWIGMHEKDICQT
jgi:hypothetical protein